MSDHTPTIEAVVKRVSQTAFGNPLVTNVLRGHLVEAMIALVLEPDWTWCAGDYSSWDFERADGVRVEIKQSSLRQTWDPPAHGKIYTSFDIRERTGRWEGAVFIGEPGRAAHIYIFAYHGISDESADHRDPKQWEFYVVGAGSLPKAKRIGLKGVREISEPVDIGALGQRLATIAAALSFSDVL